MSPSEERAARRALARLAAPNAILATDRDGIGFGVFADGDRRRRPMARLGAQQVKALAADGVLVALDDKGAFVLSEAGRARVRRDGAAHTERYLAQHGELKPRPVIDADGEVRVARGFDRGASLRRLISLRDARGEPWLNAQETAAALRLREDWEAGQIGLVRGSDWTAPPRSDGARAPGNAQEGVMMRGCDARKRVADALGALAPPLRRVVECVCLREEGLEVLERSEGWPARSGKIALKLGLAQLAVAARR